MKKIRILNFITDNYLILKFFSFLQPKEKLEFSLTCRKIKEIGDADMLSYLKKNYNVCSICRDYPKVGREHFLTCSECKKDFCIMKMNVCKKCSGRKNKDGKEVMYISNKLSKDKLYAPFRLGDFGWNFYGVCRKCAGGLFKNYVCKDCK